MSLSRGWAMRVKAPEWGKSVEVGFNAKLKHIRIRVKDGNTGGLASTAITLADARMLRRFLSRAIHELTELYPEGLAPK